MKKKLIISGILLVAVVITACSSANGQGPATQVGGEVVAQGNTAQTGQQTPVPGQAGEFSMPLAMQLALGTFKLEETDYPVEGAQAQELLTLWKAARSLSESDTTAAEEVEALVNQIRDSMTVEQMQAIEAMDLNFEDMSAIFEELGLEFGGAGRFGEMTPEMQATMEAMRESGDFPRGGPGGEFPGGGPGGGAGGGPGGGFGGEFNPQAIQTAVAERGGLRGYGLGLNPALLDAIIDFLQAKVE